MMLVDLWDFQLELPEIPDASIFDHKVDLLIVSNVFFNQ